MVYIALFFIFFSQVALSNTEIQENPEEFLTRKKHTSSIIFGGLAQACAHLGSVIGAENQGEKQQGVLNVVSTVFNTAAQLAAPSKPKPDEQSPQNQEQKKSLGKKVLVFAPHPDDDVLGCGGAIAKHIKHGDQVTVVFMTSGDACYSTLSKKEIALVREQEAQEATAILQVQSTIFLRNPDGKLAYNKKTVDQAMTVILQEQPDIMYIPHKIDAHHDHINTHKIVTKAIKNLPAGEKITTLCYEVWTPLQSITHTEDITEFVSLKVNAMKKHQSQLAIMAFDEAIVCLNHYRGIMTEKGVFCECFQEIKIKKS